MSHEGRLCGAAAGERIVVALRASSHECSEAGAGGVGRPSGTTDDGIDFS